MDCRANGAKAGRETALAASLEELAHAVACEDAWLDVAIEHAIDAGFDGPEDVGCEAYVDAFVTAAIAATREKAALEGVL